MKTSRRGSRMRMMIKNGDATTVLKTVPMSVLRLEEADHIAPFPSASVVAVCHHNQEDLNSSPKEKLGKGVDKGGIVKASI